jgi:tagatose-1,6-bisphosphate aldolase non-catalytic subunit AgaZ/GatZ
VSHGADTAQRASRLADVERALAPWLVLEQDLAITGTEPPVDGGPALDVARSIEFLSTPAPRRERVSLP